MRQAASCSSEREPKGSYSRLTTVPCLFYDGTMHKEELVKQLSKKYRRSQKHYQEALTEILEEITDQLKQGKPVHLLGFGSFYTRMRKPSTGRNFKTKEPLTIPEVRLAAFRPGKLLKQAVRKKEQSGSKKTKKGLLNRFLH